MSLSKFYRNSTIFQPEELISRKEKSSSNWQPLEQPLEHDPRQGFQKGEIPAIEPAAISPDTSSEEASLTLEESPPYVAPPEIETENYPEKTEPAVSEVETEIDLSDYMELNLAEEKIEAAFQKGLQAGREKAEEDFGTATQALLLSCEQLDTIRETIIRNSSSELQDFALAIAERILRVAIREQDRTIIATIEEALRRAVKSEEFTVFVHPEDYQCVLKKAPELVAGLTGLNKIIVKEDLSIERGGAKLESENCTIDATLASQFDIIREEINRNSQS